ncbi:hypothetical protein [Helicobacter japonicus]|uniref:hypothetical protein n=1 Tax=Helicobacter japonicus TaxID=425400 RepID=UPI0023F0532B|nr:hypothetical protein [Helicobacter japonicus]
MRNNRAFWIHYLLLYIECYSTLFIFMMCICLGEIIQRIHQCINVGLQSRSVKMRICGF